MKPVFAAILVLGGLAVAAYVWWIRRPIRSHRPASADIFQSLRRAALRGTPEELSIAPGHFTDGVWGIVMDWAVEEGVSTTIALGDGNASIYFSSGGGVIGGGAHEPIRKAARSLIDVAARFRKQCAPLTSDTVPAAGRVRIALRTIEGTVGIECATDDLVEDKNPLSPVFHESQTLIHLLNRLSSAKDPGKR